jgi:hypothetical protein
MTMQVVMQGTDGIVLASDLLWADNNQKIRPSQLSLKSSCPQRVIWLLVLPAAWRLPNG